MLEIAILGIGQTPIAEQWGKSLRQLAGEALAAAMADAHMDAPQVQALCVGNMLSGPLNRQENIGALIADWAGLRNVEASKIEAACGSGAAGSPAGALAAGAGGSCV